MLAACTVQMCVCPSAACMCEDDGVCMVQFWTSSCTLFCILSGGAVLVISAGHSLPVPFCALWEGGRDEWGCPPVKVDHATVR